MVQEINFPVYPYNNLPVERPLQRPRKLIDLLRAVHGHVDAKTATYVHIRKLERLHDTEGKLSIRAITTTTDPKDTPPTRTHYCSVRVRDPNYKGKIFDSPGVIVDCTCPRFVFMWEYALWYRGAAQMLRCNGEYPEQTNGMLSLGMCKHLIALSLEILRRKV